MFDGDIKKYIINRYLLPSKESVMINKTNYLKELILKTYDIWSISYM